MKPRLLTGLAMALALGGCTTYGYVDDGGGYYTGGSSTHYVYPAYGYGVYGYGSPYYRYSPGWSFGLGYGYGGGYPYYPAYRPPYHYSRPPYYYPRPSHPGHDHGGRPDHDGRPDHRPPVVDGNPPPLDRAPWRDLERLRRGDGDEGGPRRQPAPGTMSAGPMPMPGASPGRQPGGSARPVPPPGYGMGGPRSGSARADDPVVSRPSPRAERSMQRSASRASESHDSGRRRSGTPDTIEP